MEFVISFGEYRIWLRYNIEQLTGDNQIIKDEIAMLVHRHLPIKLTYDDSQITILYNALQERFKHTV